MDIIKEIGKAYNIQDRDVIWLCNALVIVVLKDGTRRLWQLENEPTWRTIH